MGNSYSLEMDKVTLIFFLYEVYTKFINLKTDEAMGYNRQQF